MNNRTLIVFAGSASSKPSPTGKAPAAKSRRRYFLPAGFIAILTACNPPVTTTTMDMGSVDSTPSTTLTVKSGEKIQDAVAKAKDGYTVEVEPGTYNEEVDIPTTRALKNFTLRCKKGMNGERVVLDGKGTMQNGVFVAGATGFTMEGCKVQNYKENGVWVGKSSDLVFKDLIVIKAGKYGVFPQECTNVKISDSIASEIADAAFYVGQSTGTLIVENNEAFASVTGFECENSVGCIFRNNKSHDNASGMLVFTLPGLARKDCTGAQLYNNTIENNNIPNFANPTDVVANVPSGSGITIIGADDVNVHDNIIKNNKSYAIGLVSLTLLTGSDPIDVDPTPLGCKFQNNTLTGNGTASMWSFKGSMFSGGDFAYDGSGATPGPDTNCEKNNTSTGMNKWVLAMMNTCM